MKYVYTTFTLIVAVLIWMIQPLTCVASENVSENDIYSSECLSVSENVLSDVSFSTVPKDMFVFIMDPTGLIHATDGAKYNGAAFGEGNVFFRNDEMSYSNTSNYVQIVNYGYTQLKVTVTAVLTISDAVRLTDRSDFNSGDCCLYLALKDGSQEIPIQHDGMKNVAEMTSVIPAMQRNVGTTYEFALTGECSASGEWSQVPSDETSIEITWKVEPIQNETSGNMKRFMCPTTPVESTETEEETTEGVSAETPIEETTEEVSAEIPTEETIEEVSTETPTEETAEEVSAETPIEESSINTTEEEMTEKTNADDSVGK